MLKALCWIAGAGAAGALFLGSAPADLSYAKDIQPIFDRTCVNCHGQKRKKAGLDLSAAAAYGNLVGVPSKEVPAMLRVKPGDPEQSYLWLKLDHRSEEGGGMPRGIFFAKRLPQAELELIKAWITVGAKE